MGIFTSHKILFTLQLRQFDIISTKYFLIWIIDLPSRKIGIKLQLGSEIPIFIKAFEVGIDIEISYKPLPVKNMRVYLFVLSHVYRAMSISNNTRRTRARDHNFARVLRAITISFCYRAFIYLLVHVGCMYETVQLLLLHIFFHVGYTQALASHIFL